jgi:methionyl aminopeptidase
MTIEREDQLNKLRTVGRLVARTLTSMGKALEPGMTTRELDDLGRALLEREGARSAPEVTYGFPGATCISVGPDCAHGIPDGTVVKAGDLINIDVSAELDGYFGDTGESFAVPPARPRIERLCRDGRRAMWAGIRAVKPGRRLNEVGRSIEGFARANGYSLVRNLASHGVGRSLHDEPAAIPTCTSRGTGARSPRAWSSPSSPSCRSERIGWRSGTTDGHSARLTGSPRCSTSTRSSPPAGDR